MMESVLSILQMGLPFGSVYRKYLFAARTLEAQQIENDERHDRNLA